MPRVLSAQNRSAFAQRLAEYAAEARLSRCLIVLHGGEPLLAGPETIVTFVRKLRSCVASDTIVEVGVQTNGLLLTDALMDEFEAERISVSLSLDGPREANDRHRLSRRGRSSFDRALLALERLSKRPAIFAGVIAVIDPAIPPAALFDFFDQHRPPKLDFLLPDANHLTHPPGRTAEANLYRDWLIEAFDIWFDRFPHLPLRMFEALLDALSGLSTGTDAFGLGDVSLLTIETDGSYHDLDVLKVTAEGISRLEGSVLDRSIANAVSSEKLETHRRLLQQEGLSATCQACSEAGVCGGGSVPHRFGAGGFDNPSVYCLELYDLIRHARQRLAEAVAAEGGRSGARSPDVGAELGRFEVAETAAEVVSRLWTLAADESDDELRTALDIIERRCPDTRERVRFLRSLDRDRFRHLAVEPDIMAWQWTLRRIDAGVAVHTVEGRSLGFDLEYLNTVVLRASEPPGPFALGENHAWLRVPFGSSVSFESPEHLVEGRARVERALSVINAWRPTLGSELRQICRAIQFVHDPSANPEKIVSFSDNSVPGAIYVSLRRGAEWIDSYDLADSLIHEHRHQKLYLLERTTLLIEPTTMMVESPWREDLRPPSGLLHAVFVFVELRRFWRDVLECGPSHLNRQAEIQVAETDARLERGINTLQGCPLTTAGRELVSVLDAARRRLCLAVA